MILCKITNNTNDGIALNWVRGGISIPKGSAAVLDYDPFTLMDRNSNVYHNALEIVDSGLVSIGYFVQAPAVALESIDSPVVQKDIPVDVKPEKEAPKEKGPFEAHDPYHKNEFQDSVNTPKAKKADEQAEPVVMKVSVPKDAPKQTALPEGDPISPDAVPEVTPKKTSSSKKTKKL
jgi:hypothetical protein